MDIIGKITKCVDFVSLVLRMLFLSIVVSV